MAYSVAAVGFSSCFAFDDAVPMPLRLQSLRTAPTVRIWLSTRLADPRKSFDSLAALVRDGFRGDPLSGDIFVLRDKPADRIRLLLWEEDGYAIWYKRLEKVSYRSPAVSDWIQRMHTSAPRHRSAHVGC